jgi:hypothetical protein
MNSFPLGGATKIYRIVIAYRTHAPLAAGRPSGKRAPSGGLWFAWQDALFAGAGEHYVISLRQESGTKEWRASGNNPRTGK